MSDDDLVRLTLDLYDVNNRPDESRASLLVLAAYG